ncbi:MAG: 1-acyl-sn-glycerol-3-phosphate acyltransferase [Candidatus Marinimicrobia bacterium]|nr:1-acyl-sn-glycerol-3-phosphate acyltransferase [Candidatus Neomarinimicrobiota bacterium]
MKTLISLLLWPLVGIIFILFFSFYLLLLLFIPVKKLHPIVKGGSKLMMFCAGQKLNVKGTPPKKTGEPYLYLFNHESMFDHFMLVSAVDHYISGVGKESQFSWPIWGFLIKKYGAIPIQRSNLTSAIESLSLAEKEIKKGISFIISPEGTRTLSGSMGPFKKGAFHVAKNTGVTIIPTGIIGAYKAKKKYDWHLYPGTLTVNFGDPIYSGDYKDLTVENLRDLVKEKITNLIS